MYACLLNISSCSLEQCSCMTEAGWSQSSLYIAGNFRMVQNFTICADRSVNRSLAGAYYGLMVGVVSLELRNEV